MHSDHIFISLWFLGILVFNSFIVGGAVRYNTLFLPPLLISYFTLLGNYKEQFKFNLFKLSILIFIFTLITGLLVAYADYETANSYRDFTNKIPQNYKSKNNIVHFVGGDGFQYYMSEKGYRMLSSNDNSPKEGDIIIKARLPNPRKISNDLRKRMTLIKTISYEGRIPVRTQNTEAHAGYYTYTAGFLPYSISNAKLEHFDIYRVKK